MNLNDWKTAHCRPNQEERQGELEREMELFAQRQRVISRGWFWFAVLLAAGIVLVS